MIISESMIPASFKRYWIPEKRCYDYQRIDVSGWVTPDPLLLPTTRK
jgi:hypothetical protein